MRKKKLLFMFLIILYVINNGLKMIQKRFQYIIFLDLFIFGMSDFLKDKSMNQTGDKNKISFDKELLFTKYNVKLPFEKQDELKAKKVGYKERVGQKASNFYCILIRDNSYLNITSNTKGTDWSYHNYRNSKVRNIL